LMFDGGKGRSMADVGPVAAAAEAAGFASMWVPEHVVFFEHYQSRYPYNETGQIPARPDQGLFDPLFVLQAAASATSTIRLGTSILILPQRNPVVLAQEIVALDHASGGRFEFGIGVGWSEEEFDALGIPWSRRGPRTDDYLRAMKVLWQDPSCSYDGEFVRFADVIANPKPVQQPHPPIVVGGQTTGALRRAARLGDAWYGWNLAPPDLEQVLDELDGLLAVEGRDRSSLTLRVGNQHLQEPDAILDYQAKAGALGIQELVIIPGRRGQLMPDRLAELGADLGLS
jgi:probable F420-dependent oxidoreductase